MNKSKNIVKEIYNCKVEELTSKINEKWQKEKLNIKDKEEESSQKLSFYTEESYKKRIHR